MSWCARWDVSTQVKTWCPDVEWRLLTPSAARREELTQWAEKEYTKRWITWEKQNAPELDQIDMIAEVMEERREDIIKVMRLRRDRNDLRREIDESIAAERELRDKKTKELEGEPKKRRPSATRWWQKESWGDPATSHGEAIGAGTQTSAWEQRRRERMALWEAPPPGPPLKEDVNSKEKEES